MPTTAPLQLLLFRNAGDSDVLPYEEAIVRAFQGGKDPGGYLATGDDLGIQLEVFSGAPISDRSVAETLDSFSHTLTVVLIDREMLSSGSDALWDWLAECWTKTHGPATAAGAFRGRCGSAGRPNGEKGPGGRGRGLALGEGQNGCIR